MHVLADGVCAVAHVLCVSAQNFFKVRPRLILVLFYNRGNKEQVMRIPGPFVVGFIFLLGSFSAVPQTAALEFKPPTEASIPPGPKGIAIQEGKKTFERNAPTPAEERGQWPKLHKLSP